MFDSGLFSCFPKGWEEEAGLEAPDEKWYRRFMSDDEDDDDNEDDEENEI